MTTDYDTAKITVSPETLNSVFSTVKNLTDEIATSLADINTTLNGLQLSWTGSSSSLMQSFADRWQSAADSLFGTKKDPNEGALVRLLSGIEAAGQNYDAAENWSITNFGQLAGNLLAASQGQGGGSNPGPQGVSNSSGQMPTTFITETF